MSGEISAPRPVDPSCDLYPGDPECPLKPHEPDREPMPRRSEWADGRSSYVEVGPKNIGKKFSAVLQQI